MLCGHHISEIKILKGYFKGETFKACLMKSKSKTEANFGVESRSVEISKEESKSSQIWTIDSDGSLKNLTIYC